MRRSVRHSDRLEFFPSNPGFVEMVREAFYGQPFMAHLGATLELVDPGFCEIHLPNRSEMSQNLGYFHGGAIAALADVCGGFAGWSLQPEGMGMLTVEYKTNIMAPGQGERLIGRGRVIKSGRTLTISEVEILVVDGGEKRLCATALQTLMAVPLNT